jgi:hypothetical protein
MRQDRSTEDDGNIAVCDLEIKMSGRIVRCNTTISGKRKACDSEIVPQG